MATSEEAQAVFRAVRAFFKGDPKSTNKRYEPADSQKTADRNTLREFALELGANRITAMQAPLREYAAKIAAVGEGYRAGNCYEMSALACFYAARQGVQGVWLCAQDAPGDHVFCLLGPAERPGWRNVVGMNLGGEAGAWIVDPWAATCCQAPSYPNSFVEKMKAWAAEGKQVCFENRWIRPNDDAYLAAFRTAGLLIRRY
jgi:hypothetical protein